MEKKAKVSLEEVLFIQKVVFKEGVEEYSEKIRKQLEIEPAKAKYCKHNDKFYIIDGTHRSYTQYHKFGIKEAEIEYEDCSNPFLKKPNKKNHCVVKDEFEPQKYFQGSIHDLVMKNLDEEA